MNKKAKNKKQMYCEVCGLAVTVDEECGCVNECDLICCGKPLKEKKSTKTTKKGGK
ncbi:MAG: hypothetical protein ACK4WJ_02435 [Endomicrobiia bacterium]